MRWQLGMTANKRGLKRVCQALNSLEIARWSMRYTQWKLTVLWWGTLGYQSFLSWESLSFPGALCIQSSTEDFSLTAKHFTQMQRHGSVAFTSHDPTVRVWAPNSSASQPVGHNPLGVRWSCHRDHVRTLENTDIYLKIHNSKITVMSSDECNFMVGGHDKIRNWVKGSQR